MLCIVGELAGGGSVLWLLVLVTWEQVTGGEGELSLEEAALEQGVEGEEEMGQDEREESPAQKLSG